MQDGVHARIHCLDVGREVQHIPPHHARCQHQVLHRGLGVSMEAKSKSMESESVSMVK